MKKIGLFFGSDTGNTERVAELIVAQLGSEAVEVYDIADTLLSDLQPYSYLIFGVPTWYYGEIQCDWDAFLPKLRQYNFTKKTVAIYGCGDQEDYGDYFCDAIGMLYHCVLKQGGTLVGTWPASGYHFTASKALLPNGRLAGLAIDEDRQPELTNPRIITWCDALRNTMLLEKAP